MPGFAAGGWQGIVAPLGTPATAIQKVNAGLKKVLAEPDIAEPLGAARRLCQSDDPPEVNAFINAQQAQWRPVLQAFVASVKDTAKIFSAGYARRTVTKPSVMPMLGRSVA